MSESAVPSKALDNVSVGRSEITFIERDPGGLVYRGFDIHELIPGLPYESVVELLLRGNPPSEDPSSWVTTELQRRRTLPSSILQVIDALPTTLPPLEALRTILSAMGDGTDPYPPTPEQGLTVMARLPVAFARFIRRSRSEAPIEPRADLGQVANYLWMLTGMEPSATRRRALESYFVLLAEHGMNASTFALRVVISTQSDLVSAETAALGALKGPIHGGAPSRVIDMLDAIGSPERAHAWIVERLARKELLYGFGHRVYKSDDPRGLLLHSIARTVADPARLALAESVEQETLTTLRAARPQSRLFTNVEYYSAVVLEAVGLPREFFTPTFAIARTAGWAAHAIEQAGANRLIRPEIDYVGPPTGRRWPRVRPDLA